MSKSVVRDRSLSGALSIVSSTIACRGLFSKNSRGHGVLYKRTQNPMYITGGGGSGPYHGGVLTHHLDIYRGKILVHLNSAI